MTVTGRWIAGISAAAWGITAAAARWDQPRVPRPDVPDRPDTDAARITIVLPARDEAEAIGDAVRSHLCQTHVDIEVIVADDGSTDDTVTVAHRAAEGDPRLRIISAGPLPDGWIGKSWACHRGAQEATGDWLLFTDADVVHAPDTLAACLRLARSEGRAGVTLAPHILTGSASERIVLPAAAFIIFAVMAPGPLARSSRSGVTMAAGAFMLIRRDVYDGIGGHERIHGHMVDDLALARAVKDGGDLLIPADGTDLIRLRMYHGVRAMWRGWRKNAAFASPRGRTRGLAPAVLLGVLALSPVVATVRGTVRREPALAALGVLGLGGQMWAQRLTARITPTPRGYAPTFPLGVLFMALVAARGAVDRLTGRGPVWRGRRYPQAAGPRRRSHDG